MGITADFKLTLTARLAGRVASLRNLDKADEEMLTNVVNEIAVDPNLELKPRATDRYVNDIFEVAQHFDVTMTSHKALKIIQASKLPRIQLGI